MFFRRKNREEEDEEETTLNEEEDEADEEERELLSREDVLERLRECWEILSPSKGALTPAGKEVIELNFALARIWSEVNAAEEVRECEGAIGFHYDEDEEEWDYNEGDYPDDENEIQCTEMRE